MRPPPLSAREEGTQEYYAIVNKTVQRHSAIYLNTNDELDV